MISKALIFDSSSIITLALNNLLNILPALKEAFGGKFLITPEVKKEIIDSPLKSKRFKLEALLISDMLKKGVFEVSFPEELEKETNNAMKIANSIFAADSEKLKILHEGEASCFALAKILSEEYKVYLAIDERTLRILVEKPENLQKLFEKKLHTAVKADKPKFSYFSGLGILRSSELLFIAYKKGVIDLPAKPEQVIDALLFAAKFKGCSISYNEIEKAKALVNEI
jgi:predicted nucleic acid-binding protein